MSLGIPEGGDPAHTQTPFDEKNRTQELGKLRVLRETKKDNNYYAWNQRRDKEGKCEPKQLPETGLTTTKPLEKKK